MRCHSLTSTWALSEVTQKQPELKRKVMGLINERKRDDIYLACLLTDALETAVLVVVSSMNIHQYDLCHFLDPHVPSYLTTG